MLTGSFVDCSKASGRISAITISLACAVLCACSAVKSRDSNCCISDAQDAHKDFRKDLSRFEKHHHDYLDTDALYHTITAGEMSGKAGEEIRRTHRLKTHNRPGLSYLISIEKTKNQYVKYDLDCSREPRSQSPGCLFSDEAEESLHKQYKSVLEGQVRRLLPTHIVKFDSVDLDQDCFLLTSYVVSDRLCPQSSTISEMDSVESRFNKSWSAMSRKGVLHQDILNSIPNLMEKPTHIFLLSTGWNTAQSESIDNYNDWIDLVQKSYVEAGINQDFRPIYIGISWPSTWFFPILGSKLSVLTKGNDADEAGLVWINLLVNDVLKRVKADHGLKIVMIGHSYGTRILGYAASSGHILPNPSRVPIDYFIGLQGAFGYKRLLNRDDGAEGAPFRYLRDRSRVLNVAFTTSEHDKANRLAFWSNYIGRIDDRKLSLTEKQHFQVVSVNMSGNFSSEYESTQEKILLIDASKIIRCKKPGTGGGAHSDVFNQEMGRLIVQLVFGATTPDHIPSNCES